MPEKNIIIKPRRDKPILNQHPWVFSGAIRAIEGMPEDGDIVTVRAHDHAYIGKGYWNTKSQIRVRMLTWEDEIVDNVWWRDMLENAISRSNRLQLIQTNPLCAIRLVNAENDYIPGLIVDYYAGWLVLQALTLGIDIYKSAITESLVTILGKDIVHGVYERSDVDIREKEGLEQVTGVLWGDSPPSVIRIFNQDRYQFVDVIHGHKTGHYLDQMANHQIINTLIQRSDSEEVSVLNLFSFTGGFGLFAENAKRVVNVDASHEALQNAERNVLENELLDVKKYEYIQADVFEYLRDLADLGEEFDIVVLDPPKFAHNKKQVENASRGYKDINLNALHLIKTGGYLVTFSCSGSVSADLFQKIVFGALVDSGRKAQIVQRLGANDDHPIALTFPEGEYLKGLILRVY